MKHVSLCTLILALACTFAILCSAHPASAQVPGAGLPSGIGVSAFVPTSREAVRTGGALQSAAELRYGLPSVPLTPTRTVLSIGAEWGSRNGNHSLIVPVSIAEYVGLNGKSPSANGSPYAGIGIGYDFMQQSGYGNRGEVGGFGTLGYNFPFGLFVEGKYQAVSRGNGFLFSLGLRF